MNDQTQDGKRSWTDKFEAVADKLLGRTKELIAEGNVRRIVVKNGSGKQLFRVPMNAGVAVGTVAVFINPLVTAIGAFGFLLARMKIEVVRKEDSDSDDRNA